MSRLKQRNTFAILTYLTIFAINVISATTAVNGHLSSKQPTTTTERSPIQLLTEYELGDEMKKCSKVRSDSDIFVMPFTTHDDPLRILVPDNAVDQIIAHIFGLVCGVMGYQEVQYIPWSSKKIGELGRDEGIITNISREGAASETDRDNLSISLSLGVRYLPESHMSYDHGVDLGPLTMPGFYGLYRVSKRHDMGQDLTYRVLQSSSKRQDGEFLELLDSISVSKFSNSDLCAPKREMCAVIVAQDRDETQFIEDYLRAYQLRTQVFWLGPNFKKGLKTLVGATKEPFYVLHWTPSDITHVILGPNATLVKMPSCNNVWDLNSPKTHLKCMFDPIPQIKFANEMLKKIPGLDLYLKEQFTFTQGQYLGIIRDFEVQNKTIEEFACSWLSDHPEFYQEKVKATQTSEDFEIILALISPVKNNPLIQAAQKAISLINDQKWLKKHHLVAIADTDHFNQVQAMKVTNRIAEVKAKVVIGPSRTSEVQIVADITNMANIPLITYLPSVALSSEDYGHTLHTVGDNTIYVNITLALMQQMGWKQMAILTEVGLSNTKYVAEMKTQFSYRGYSLLEHSFKSGTDLDIVTSLGDIKEKDYKIIFIDVRPENYMKIMRLAKNETMYQRFFESNCVWITPINLIELDIDTEEEESILTGTLSILPAPYGNLSSTLTFEPTKTTADWRHEFETTVSSDKLSQVYSNYAGFVYDTVLALGLAFREIEQKHRHLLAPLGNSQNLTDILVDILRSSINFTGVTGPMVFDEHGKREMDFEVWQWENGWVGVFDHVIAQLNYGPEKYQWKNGTVPHDRSYCGFGIPCKYSTLTLLLVLGSFLVIVLPLGSFFHFKRNYKRKIAVANQRYLESCEEFKLMRWEISPADVEIGKTLGRGHYAKVCLGTLRHEAGERQVAVKQLRGQSSRYLREFFYEAEILKGIDHENIVKLLGVYFDQGNFHIVMEYLENDNLNKFLKKRKRLLFDNYYHMEISPNRLTGFAKDVASALCHLEKCKIVHCDIATRNVLLSTEVGGRKKAKLSDFGLSLDITRLATYRPRDPSLNPEMPVRLMSPETLRHKIFSFKSDIWSFGVLLFEITTFGSVPYAHVHDIDVIQHVLDGNALILPQDVTPEFKRLIDLCLHHDPTKRPSADIIKDTLTRTPDLIRACPDPDTDFTAESLSSPYHPDTGYSTSNGILNRSPPHSRARTITYSSLANSDYSEMRGGSTMQRSLPPTGAYLPIDNALGGNYQASNSSTSPLLTGGSDYLQMSPLMQTNGTSQNHDRNGDENLS